MKNTVPDHLFAQEGTHDPYLALSPGVVLGGGGVAGLEAAVGWRVPVAELDLQQSKTLIKLLVRRCSRHDYRSTIEAEHSNV